MGNPKIPLIHPDETIKNAMKKLNETAQKTLLVVDENKRLLGTLTDGDIRRFVLKYGHLEGKVKDVYNPNPISLVEGSFTAEDVKNIFLGKKVELIPITDKKGVVKGYISWNEFFKDSKGFQYLKFKGKLDIPVVIMAGGKGTRLKPFTKVFPKPLIPIGEKPMIEAIVDHFKNFGVKKFFVIINYKGYLIETYFNGIERDYEVEFIREKEFLGTAGSLKLLEGKIKGDFIVSNCDILVNADFTEVLDFHRRNEAFFTSVTAFQHYKIPYGVVKTKPNGFVEDIEEKPEYVFQINTGVYILNDKVLNYIKPDEYLDMPILIKRLIEDGKKVLAYPVQQSQYVDFGQWDEYKKALKILEELWNV